MKKYKKYYIIIILLVIVFGLMFWLKYNLPYLKFKGIYESEIKISNDIINTELTLYFNRTFNYKNDYISFSGDYIIENNEIALKYKEYTIEDEYNYNDKIIINNEKLCKDIECNNYYIKDNKTNILMNDLREIKYINYDEYLNLYNNNKNNIVVIYTENCTYCKKYKEELNNISKIFNNPIYIIDIDENEQLKEEYKEYPTTLIINNNKVEYKFIGNRDFNGLFNLLKSNNINLIY